MQIWLSQNMPVVLWLNWLWIFRNRKSDVMFIDSCLLEFLYQTIIFNPMTTSLCLLQPGQEPAVWWGWVDGHIHTVRWPPIWQGWPRWRYRPVHQDHWQTGGIVRHQKGNVVSQQGVFFWCIKEIDFKIMALSFYVW